MKIKPLEDRHKQWDLKAGFAADGRMISLRDLVSGATLALPPDRLTEQQQRELTLARLRCFPDYRLAVLGRRWPVSQRRALKEVREGTGLGRFLVETEQNIIRLLLERSRRSKMKMRVMRHAT